MTLNYVPNPEPTKVSRERRAEELILRYLDENGLRADGCHAITMKQILQYFDGMVPAEELEWVNRYFRKRAIKDAAGILRYNEGLVIRRASGKRTRQGLQQYRIIWHVPYRTKIKSQYNGE